MAKKETIEDDPSTAERIKSAARKVFHKKGYAATRTRDIADEAGINLALLNYYFRSKEKLFDIIMLETMTGFFHMIKSIFNDETTTLEQKIERIASSYIDLLLVQPNIPLFILSELRSGNPDRLLSRLSMNEVIMHSKFAAQYEEGVKAGHIVRRPLIHLVMNLIAFCVFPFVGAPLLRRIGNMSDDQFKSLLVERKKLIPMWINATLKAR